MNQIQQLINQMCPNGVEWKTLGEVCEIGTGNSNRQDATDDGQYPFFVRSKDVLKIDTFEYNEESIIIPGEGGIGDIFHYIKGKYALHQRAYRVHPISDKLCGKFLYYYLFANFKLYINSKAVNATVTSIRKPMLEGFQIPVPPLAIQTRIVEILDHFTNLTANLTAELNLRRKQFEHYREKLLSLDGEEGVEWKKLGEVAENLDSKRKPITSSNRVSGDIPYYGASGIVDYVDGFIFDGDYLLISEDGANLLSRNTPIAFSISGKTWVNNHAHILYFEKQFCRKFVEYYINKIDLTPYISDGAQPKLNQANLNRISIPYPSDATQHSIVSILDKFTALIENIEKELALRQKQYEYYREELLRFGG